jgi:hypothetical protein
MSEISGYTPEEEMEPNLERNESGETKEALEADIRNLEQINPVLRTFNATLAEFEEQGIDEEIVLPDIFKQKS